VLAYALCASTAFPQSDPGRAVTRKHSQKYAPWTFQEDFSKGIPGWMSFPLAQDVGYDPTIYTTIFEGAPALVRDVTAVGQRHLRIGLVRPLRFHATSSSIIEISYDLSVCGRITHVEFSLGGLNGKRYSAVLPPRPGHRQVRISGRSMGLTDQGTGVELAVVLVDIAKPLLGSHNRLIVKSFSVHAERVPEVSVLFPTLAYSRGTGVAVAKEWVSENSELRLRLAPGVGNAEITLRDGLGNAVVRQNAGQKTDLDLPMGTSAAPGLWQAEIRRDGSRSEFRFLVLGQVPPHPRVLLTPERLKQLSSQMYGNALSQSIHQKASDLAHLIAYNPLAGDNIASLPSDSVFPGLPEYFTLMENYSSAIAYNALDFRLTGKLHSFESARRALLSVSAWPTWTPPWFAAHGLYTYYEVGVFTQRVSFGYDLIADRLTANEKQIIANALLHKSIEPALQEYFWNDRLPIAASNHMAQSIGGAIEACVATYGDVPGWDSRFGPALAELIVDYENLLQGLFPGDGSGAEPSGYQDFAQAGMSWGMAALHSLLIHPRGSERMLEGFKWLRYIELRPDLILDTGDSGTSLSALSGYAWSAEHSDDPAARNFYEMAPRLTLSAFLKSAQHSGSAPTEVPGLLDLICCTSPIRSAPPDPPSRLFPLRGSAALRSGWSAEDTLVSIRIGPWFNHEHHDEGSFQVAAFGEELISEAGYADYYKEPHYADYFTQAAGHNTVLVDGDAFSQNSYAGRFWPAFQNYPRILHHVLGEGIDFLSADLAPAYNGALQKYTREFLFLKPSFLIVHDRIQASEAHRFSFLLHLPADDLAQTAGGKTKVTGKGASALILTVGDDTKWILERTPSATSAYTEFDKDPLKLPSQFRLDSPETSRHEFLVGMDFVRGSSGDEGFRPVTTSAGRGFEKRTAENTDVALFRAYPGDLQYEGVLTDGETLALQKAPGLRQAFAGRARSLRDGNRVIYSSDELTDVVISLHSSEDLLEVFASTAAEVTIQLQDPVRAVDLDSQPAQRSISRNLVKLRIPEGEHCVRILH
jgi:Heparinase II/III-like protein